MSTGQTYERPREEAPMACCPSDDEPLVWTMAFQGVEFICIICRRTYGFLDPKGMPVTPERQARQAELKGMWDIERAERKAKRNEAGL